MQSRLLLSLFKDLEDGSNSREVHKIEEIQNLEIAEVSPDQQRTLGSNVGTNEA